MSDTFLDRLWKVLNEPGGELVQPSEDEGEDEQGKHSGHQEDESPH